MESGSAAEPKARGVNARGVTAPGVMAADVKAALAELADGEDAGFLQRFFKTGPGQYGAGDVFIGVRVPATRGVAKLFQGLPLDEIAVLLDSEVHEHRLAGLIILNARFARASRQKTRDDSLRETMVRFYLDAVRRGRVNNWDLVDSSAEFVLGEFLIDRPRDLLFDLAASEKLWERRVAMLSTFAFLKQGDASTTIEIAECCSATARTSSTRRSAGCCARSASASTRPRSSGSSTRTRRGCRAPPSATRPSTCHRSCGRTTGRCADARKQSQLIRELIDDVAGDLE
ncbi:MAG: alkylation repair protein [Microbacteriaceae bacterium]|nr:alkylation repair protein [Microbacteriaceae bacterium]